MNKKDVDSIAWLLHQTKNSQCKPIVFLGAGASISSGIPGTGKIIDDILSNYANKPEVKKLDADARNDYYKVVACLNTTERHKLLRGYITSPDVKINVTHIYLAQMLNEGYIDYVLTVNFDDLFLRACALFNFIPPVYDISILKDFTTTTLTERSVTYLHGQHHGFWLLNTGDELEKVKEYIRTVFDRICNNRTWIIVGYSGEDTVFDQIARLDNFTNELFWIGYNDNLPSTKVQEKLLNKPNSNASWVSGYDSDSFFLKLHSELGMTTPNIFNKPFTFLKGFMQNIRDINENMIKSEFQNLFKNVKDRYDVALRQTDAAIKQYEESNPDGALSLDDINSDQLKKDIIEAIVKEDFVGADNLFKRSDGTNGEINKSLSTLFYNWGVKLLRIDLVPENAIEKFKEATNLDSTNSHAYNGWAAALLDLAKINNDEKTYEQAIEILDIALKTDPQNYLAYSNWGTALLRLGDKKNDPALYKAAIEKFKKALLIDPNDASSLYNSANAFIQLSKFVEGEEFVNALYQAKQDAEKALQLGASAYNLSCTYALLHDKTNALKYLEQSLSKKRITTKAILDDDDWKEYYDDEDFKKLINKYS